MSYGFSGKAGKGYLEEIEEALKEAGKKHSEDPLKEYTGSVPAPSLPHRQNQETPFYPDSAKGGGYSVGIGTTSNIVSNQNTYDDISGSIGRIDGQMADDISTAARELEEMCGSVFVLQKATPDYLNVVSEVTSSLGEFEDLTNTAGTAVRRYASELKDVR